MAYSNLGYPRKASTLEGAWGHPNHIPCLLEMKGQGGPRDSPRRLMREHTRTFEKKLFISLEKASKQSNPPVAT